ncbi:MAG: hypothetical protein VKK59_06730, partial [Vampirovibrionales bacterium]|nr:hypothetical protein [Vampirovibrionales bacterium]
MPKSLITTPRKIFMWDWLSHNKPRIGLLTSVLAVALFFAACKPQQALRQGSKSLDPAQGKLITLNLGSEPPTIDPAHVTDLSGFNVLNNLMRGLVQLKTDSQGVMHVAPAVARRWRVSPDGRTLNFELSHSARWSD